MAERDEEAAKRQTVAQTRIVLRPYASALPLGCFAFAIGNLLYSAFLLHWIPGSESKIVAMLLLGFAAPLELLPCAMAFLSRDTGAATAMGLFGCAWIVQGVPLLALGGDPPLASEGVFLIAIAACLLILTTVTIENKPMLAIMLIAGAGRSACAGLVEFGLRGASPYSAALGLVITAVGFYAGLGLLLEDTRGVLLPMTFRKKEAQAALEEGLEHQVRHLHREAGVREQL